MHTVRKDLSCSLLCQFLTYVMLYPILTHIMYPILTHIMLLYPMLTHIMLLYLILTHAIPNTDMPQYMPNTNTHDAAIPDTDTHDAATRR